MTGGEGINPLYVCPSTLMGSICARLPDMERALADATADLLDALEQIAIRAAILNAALECSNLAPTAAALRAHVARAVVAIQKIEHLNRPHRTIAPHARNPVLQIVRRRDRMPDDPSATVWPMS